MVQREEYQRIKTKKGEKKEKSKRIVWNRVKEERER